MVHPFDSLPPQGDVPKLSKHQINHIIDAIERVIKIQKNSRKVSTEVLYEKPVNIKPQDYWSRIKNASEMKQEEYSLFMGRFAHIAEKYEGNCKVARDTYYSMAEVNQFCNI